jgi:hypothetical protein
MQNIVDHLFEYLTKKISEFSKTKKFGQHLFTCPKIASHKIKTKTPTATFLPNSEKITCLICGFKGTIYDSVRTLEPDKLHWSDAEITDYLIGDLSLNLYSELDYYVKYGWAIIPLLKNDRVPFEPNWTESEYKDKIRWIKWLNNGLNIGVNCNKSNLTVIDVDFKVKPTEELLNWQQLLQATGTLKQITPHGEHYVFLQEAEIGNWVNLGGIHLDTRSIGGQIAIAPSKRDDKEYKWENLGTEIKKLPEDLKKQLIILKQVEKSKSSDIDSENSIQNIEGKKPLLKNDNFEGSCNNNFVQFGGVLTKIGIPTDKRNTILYWLNRNWLENPMDSKAVQSMLKSLDGYELNTEESHEKSIYEYLKLVQSDISAKDIMDSLQLPRSIVDKYLSQFVKEGKAIRMGRGRYQYKEKIDWEDSVVDTVNEYDYKMPLFNDIAIFQDADCLILGGKTNEGKTTIALNMLKLMINQGVKPYYVYNEAGSRFQKTAKLLGIEGGFYHCQHSNPLAVELERNAFSIIDWLCLENKAETDTILKHLNDELQRKRGILVIFTQLKKDYEWFAPNLIDHFPTFAARYIQDNEIHTEGHWQCDKIKEPRGNYTSYLLHCEYNRDTRVFKPKSLI